VRSHMSMNCRKSYPGKGVTPESAAEIKRITQLWRDCRGKYGQGGSMLFGEFSIADAMYAPVALRFNTYQVELDDVCHAYVSAILALPAIQEWVDAAYQETEVLSAFEPYEQQG
jgi:glutathione S-transferase